MATWGLSFKYTVDNKIKEITSRKMNLILFEYKKS